MSNTSLLLLQKLICACFIPLTCGIFISLNFSSLYWKTFFISVKLTVICLPLTAHSLTVNYKPIWGCVMPQLPPSLDQFTANIHCALIWIVGADKGETQHQWTTNASLMLSNKVSRGYWEEIDWVSRPYPFMNKLTATYTAATARHVMAQRTLVKEVSCFWWMHVWMWTVKNDQGLIILHEAKWLMLWQQITALGFAIFGTDRQSHGWTHLIQPSDYIRVLHSGLCNFWWST